MVTGAARGIGRAIGDAVLREGGNVVYADRDPGVSDVAAKAGERVGGKDAGRASFAVLDVTSRSETRAAVDKTVKEFGSLDIMYNNAGLNKPLNFLDVTEENWDLIM